MKLLPLLFATAITSPKAGDQSQSRKQFLSTNDYLEYEGGRTYSLIPPKFQKPIKALKAVAVMTKDNMNFGNVYFLQTSENDDTVVTVDLNGLPVKKDVFSFF